MSCHAKAHGRSSVPAVQSEPLLQQHHLTLKQRRDAAFVLRVVASAASGEAKKGNRL
jgi:hypothetical protein